MAKRRETSAERYKRVIRQRRIFVVCVFTIIIALCVGLFTPTFGISEIEVSGNSRLTAEEIVEASGIRPGENVFRFRKKKALKSLSAVPYIEGAVIKRKFPARLLIEIDEATQDIIIDTPTEFLIATLSGRVLEKTDDVTEIPAPLVFGMEITWAEPANRVQTPDDDILAMNLEYISCFRQTEHWNNIDEFYVGDASNFMMKMKSGLKVTFGTIESTEALQRKVKMMEAIMPQIRQMERSYLDLTTDKGYYGEYTYEEWEEIKRLEEEGKTPKVDLENTEGDEETETEQSGEEENARKKAKESEKPAEKKEDESKQSEKPSAKPSESAKPSKSPKPSAKPDENSGSQGETNKTEKPSPESEKTATPTKKPTVQNPAAGESSDGSDSGV